MDKTPQQILKIIKIQESNRGKKLSMNSLTYQMLLDKICQAFQIKIYHQYFHLYYFDQKKRKITINNPEDYQLFAQSQYEKKLYICNTAKSIFSMTNYKSKTQQTQTQLQVQSAIPSIKQKLDERLNQFKKQLKKKIEKTINEKSKMIQNKYSPKDKYKICHKQIKCDNCKSNKPIIGTRYQCVICNYNLCFTCEQLIQHPHPFFKIISSTQKIPSKQKVQISLLNQSSDSFQKQEATSSLVDELIQIVHCDRDKGVKHVSKYPNASINELVDNYFNDEQQ